MKKSIATLLILAMSIFGCGGTLRLDGAATRCYDCMVAAHEMAEAARKLGYAEDHYVIQLAQQEYADAQELYFIYRDAYENWQAKAEEYPVATYVWFYLQDEGFSDYVCAGILGNMMVECGGNTLSLQWDAYSSSYYYYGLCQWNRGGYPQVYGADLQTQCEFLQDTMKYEFDTFGSAYAYGFNYLQFLSIDDAYSAGEAFALCYERGYGTALRASCAVTAYEYFVS